MKFVYSQNTIWNDEIVFHSNVTRNKEEVHLKKYVKDVLYLFLYYTYTYL